MTDKRVENSPLKDASPRALNELFKADPETITDAELEAMVEHYRGSRKRFVEQETKNQRSGSKGTKTEVDKNVDPKDLLSSLGL